MSDKAVGVLERFAEELFSDASRPKTGDGQYAEVRAVGDALRRALSRVAEEEGAQGDARAWDATLEPDECRDCGLSPSEHNGSREPDNRCPTFTPKPAPTPAPERCAQLAFDDTRQCVEQSGHEGPHLIWQEPAASQPASGNDGYESLTKAWMERAFKAERELAEVRASAREATATLHQRATAAEARCKAMRKAFDMATHDYNDPHDHRECVKHARAVLNGDS